MNERLRSQLRIALPGCAGMLLACAAALAQDAHDMHDMHDMHGMNGMRGMHGVYGEGHAQMHSWYQTLKQPGSGISCCNNEDCRPTTARNFSGRVQVQIDGQWTDVRPDKILNTPSPDLGAHVCAPKRLGTSSSQPIYCVVLGSGV